MRKRQQKFFNPYRRALKGLFGTFVGVAIFSAAVNILMLTGPLFMLQVYDRVLSSGSIATLQGLLIAVVVAFLFLGLYDFLRTRMLSRAGYQLDNKVSKYAFESWVRSGIAGMGEARRPLNDLASVRSFLASPAMLGFFDLPWVPFYLLIVFIIHPWLGYLALVGAVVVAILAIANQYFTKTPIGQAMMMDSSESFFVDQVRRGGEVVVPLGMLDKISHHWNQMHQRGLSIGQIGGDRAEGFAATSKAIRLLLQSLLLGLGGYLALYQEISPGMIVAASIIAGRALAPLDQVIGQWRNVIKSRQAHLRLIETMQMPEEPPLIQLPEPTGDLVVKSLTKFAPGKLSSADQAALVSNVSFSLAPGEALGVIGPSASGKTTLARLLIGAWKPDSGEIRLDKATLAQWSDSVLGKYIGYLPQSLELFSGTIGQNISRFDPNADDEKIVAAAQMAGVHEMILHLPDGYGTMVEAHGSELSGGQIQRIGLARAVFGLPKVVVLDEPNSNLDAEGDDALTVAIGRLREAQSTVIVMAHRPSAIASVNKLMVINGGKIVDFGNKAEVLKRTTRPSPSPTKTKKILDLEKNSRD